MPSRFVSEDDLVANRLLPDLKDAAKQLGIIDIIDFHTQEPIPGRGRTDLTVSKGGKHRLVIEAKFRKKVGHLERDIEPRDPEVINQAVDYAVYGGFPYYATCNANRLVLFQQRADSSPYENEIASYEYSTGPEWATSLLKYTLGLEAVSLKAPDDSLVSTLKEAFMDIWPEFLVSLKKRLSSSDSGDKIFSKKYRQWLEDQGLEIDDNSHIKIAKETAYLQINKLVFFKVLRIPYAKLGELSIPEDQDIQEVLHKLYQEVLKIDYRAVYQSDVISEVPLTARVDVRLRTLIDTLNEFDFGKFRSDFVGHVYEKLIPPQERKDLGQFYTPPSVAEFITILTIGSKDAVILDPGCGSGGFLVKAYHRLRELNGAPPDLSGPLGDNIHQDLLNKVYGVDINQFPAHLSVINLAVQNSKNKSDKVNVVVKDFFDLRPGTAVLSGFESLDSNSESVEIKLPASFDNVVANPPYIRQELLGDTEKAKIRRLIEEEFRSVGIGSGSDRRIVLDKQSDIYIYFFMHGLAFLKDKGSLGFIASNKWLEVAYGEAFQQFLLENAKIQYVIEFDRAVFADADVNTAIVILQRESNPASRKDNLVKFVRIKKKVPLMEQINVIGSATQSIEDEQFRINIVKQYSLTPGKWNVFLRAPPVFQKVIKNSKVVPLESLADVFFGLKTGYNPFFVLPKSEVEERKLEKEYLKRILYSPREMDGLVIRKSDVSNYVLYVHESKSALRGTKILGYIESAEDRKVDVERGAERKPRRIPELESVAGHNPYWYSVVKLDTPDILIPKLADKRMIALLNDASVLGSDLFYYVVFKKGIAKQANVVFGFLNSTLAAMFGELYGRSYGGGVLDLKVYETKKLPVLNPLSLTSTESRAISKATDKYVEAVSNKAKVERKFEGIKSRSKRDRGLFEDEVGSQLEEADREERDALRELDDLIYDSLGLTKKERDQIQSGLEELQEIRRLRRET